MNRPVTPWPFNDLYFTETSSAAPKWRRGRTPLLPAGSTSGQPHHSRDLSRKLLLPMRHIDRGRKTLSQQPTQHVVKSIAMFGIQPLARLIQNQEPGHLYQRSGEQDDPPQPR